MDLPQLSVGIRSVDGASIVEAEGVLCAPTTDALREALQTATDDGRGMVILDLTRVRSMDAGALKLLQQTCAALGPERRLCAVACGQTRRVLEMTRLDEMIQVRPRLSDLLDPAGVGSKTWKT